MKNRSVPTDTVLPHIVYENIAGALDWLIGTFGFAEHYRYGEPLSGAQIHLGDAYVMLKAARPRAVSGRQGDPLPPSLTIFVDDIDAHYARTKFAGAKIVEEIGETCYGERQYGVEDLEGHRRLFSQHIRDVSPEEWGATIAGA